jgi:hypothetical protein
MIWGGNWWQRLGDRFHRRRIDCCHSMRKPINVTTPYRGQSGGVADGPGDWPQTSNSLRQGILDQPAAAHDQRQMGALILEQAQIR